MWRHETWNGRRDVHGFYSSAIIIGNSMDAPGYQYHVQNERLPFKDQAVSAYDRFLRTTVSAVISSSQHWVIHVAYVALQDLCHWTHIKTRLIRNAAMKTCGTSNALLLATSSLSELTTFYHMYMDRVGKQKYPSPAQLASQPAVHGSRERQTFQGAEQTRSTNQQAIFVPMVYILLSIPDLIPTTRWHENGAANTSSYNHLNLINSAEIWFCSAPRSKAQGSGSLVKSDL